MGDHMLLRDLTRPAIEQGRRGRRRQVEPRRCCRSSSATWVAPLGRAGAGQRRDRVRSTRSFAMFAVGMTMDPVMAAAVSAYLPVVKEALAR